MFVKYRFTHVQPVQEIRKRNGKNLLKQNVEVYFWKKMELFLNGIPHSPTYHMPGTLC